MSTEQVSSVPSIGVAKHRPSHPLSPLTSSEISNAAKLVQNLYPAGTKLQYKAITLNEPAKAQLIPYLDAEQNGGRTPNIERTAFVAYYIRNTVGSFGWRLFLKPTLSNRWSGQIPRSHCQPFPAKGEEQRPSRTEYSRTWRCRRDTPGGEDSIGR